MATGAFTTWTTYRHRVSIRSKLLLIGLYGLLMAYSPLHHWRLWDLSLAALVYGCYRLLAPLENRMVDSMRMEASKKTMLWQIVKHNIFALSTTERPRIGQLLAFIIPGYIAARLYSTELHGYWETARPWLAQLFHTWA
jgi:hypothetical protein